MNVLVIVTQKKLKDKNKVIIYVYVLISDILRFHPKNFYFCQHFNTRFLINFIMILLRIIWYKNI